MRVKQFRFRTARHALAAAALLLLLLLSLALPAGVARCRPREAVPADFAASLEGPGRLELEFSRRLSVRDTALVPGVGWMSVTHVVRRAPLAGDALVQLRALVGRAGTSVSDAVPSPVCDTCPSVSQDLFWVWRSGKEERVVLQIDPCARMLLLADPGVQGAVSFSESRLGLVRLLLEILQRDGRGEELPASGVDCGPYDSGQVGNVQMCDVLSSEPPTYPFFAESNRIQGTVLVDALVGTNGSVQETHVRHSIPTLDAYAVASVRQWRFRPALLQGVPIAVWVVCPVSFNLH